MAFFQRRPQTSDPKMFYTLGLNRTILIVGLGNIGKEFDGTRHNIGFSCIDFFIEKSEDMEQPIIKKDFKCYLSQGQVGETRVIAIKPTTMMNLSGESIQAVASFYKITPANILVVHDDLDIDYGQIRLRIGGSSAGHNGIKSITKIIGEDYGRVRIGIGPKPANIASDKFVLAKFNSDETSQMPNLFREVNAALSEFIFGSQLSNETRSFIV